MQAEYTISDDCSHWEVIKGIGKVFPHVCVSVFSKTFVIKAIDLSDLTTLVVSSEDRNPVSVSNLQSYKQSDSFQGIITSIDVIPHEQIIGFRTSSSDLEQLC